MSKQRREQVVWDSARVKTAYEAFRALGMPPLDPPITQWIASDYKTLLGHVIEWWIGTDGCFNSTPGSGHMVWYPPHTKSFYGKTMLHALYKAAEHRFHGVSSDTSNEGSEDAKSGPHAV